MPKLKLASSGVRWCRRDDVRHGAALEVWVSPKKK